MNRRSAVLLSGVILVALVACGSARGQSRSDDYRRSMGNLRPPSGRSQPAQESTPPATRPEPDHPRHHDGHGRDRDGCYPGGGMGYDPYPAYQYAPIYPPYASPYWLPIYPGPIVLPAEAIYGPESFRRFMGAVPNAAPPVANVIVVPNRNEDDEPDMERSTNAKAFALGRKFINYGDSQFVEQQYGQAYMRYKKSAQAAPQLAQAYLRQGWSLVASGRYELAIAAFKRGFELDPNWPKSQFRIDELYGPNRMAKTAHIDALAAAAADEPNNPDLLFLVGVFLYFDGQPHRAKPFFERMTQLPGGAGVPPGPFLESVEEKTL